MKSISHVQLCAIIILLTAPYSSHPHNTPPKPKQPRADKEQPAPLAPWRHLEVEMAKQQRQAKKKGSLKTTARTIKPSSPHTQEVPPLNEESQAQEAAEKMHTNLPRGANHIVNLGAMPPKIERLLKIVESTITERLDNLERISTDTAATVASIATATGGTVYRSSEMACHPDVTPVNTNTMEHEPTAQLAIEIRQSAIEASPRGTLTITKGGFYRVMEGLHAVGSGPIIDIACGNVTVDLGGATLNGCGQAACIRLNHTADGPVTVKNGQLTRGAPASILIKAGCCDWTLDDLRLWNNETGLLVKTDGMAVERGTIRRLVACHNQLDGLRIGTPHCQAVYGIDLRDSVAQNNGDNGFRFCAGDPSCVTIYNCVASHNGLSEETRGCGFLLETEGVTMSDCCATRNRGGNIEQADPAISTSDGVITRHCTF